MGNVAIVLGHHIDFKRGSIKYGDVQGMPQWPYIKAFSEKHKLFIFSCDKEHVGLPDNCHHFHIRSRLAYMLFGWLLVGFVCRHFNVRHCFFFGGSSHFQLLSGMLCRFNSIAICGNLLWNSSTNTNPYRKWKTIKERLFYWFERFSVRYVDIVESGSDEITRFFVSSRQFRGGFVPFGRGVNVRPVHGFMDRNPYQVIYAGRLEPLKGIKTLLLAWEYFNHDYPEIASKSVLVIAGDGSMKSQCIDMSRRFDNIKVLGWRKDVNELMAQSSILVSPSIYEASGDSISEAMALGCVVISSYHDKSIDSCVFRFNRGDYYRLEALISSLLVRSNLRLEMSNRARKYFNEHHNLHSNIIWYLNLIAK